MAMVSMTKSCEANNVYKEAENANYQELIETLKFMAFPKPLERIEDDFYANEPKQN